MVVLRKQKPADRRKFRAPDGHSEAANSAPERLGERWPGAFDGRAGDNADPCRERI